MSNMTDGGGGIPPSPLIISQSVTDHFTNCRFS